MILCTMRIGKKVKNRIGNTGYSLVELIVVIAIMAVMVGVMSLGIGMMFTRDANYVAVRIDDELTEARTLAMSREGVFTYELYIDSSDPKGSYVTIMQSIGGATPVEYKKVLFDKSVSIVVDGDGTAISPVSGKITFEFDKAKGNVNKVNGSDSDIKGVYTIKVTSTKNSSKIRDVVLASATGRHYTEK